jgi:hypothetical protein
LKSKVPIDGRREFVVDDAAFVCELENTSDDHQYRHCCLQGIRRPVSIIGAIITEGATYLKGTLEGLGRRGCNFKVVTFMTIRYLAS